jgi:hypothetical protein
MKDALALFLLWTKVNEFPPLASPPGLHNFLFVR